MTDYCSRYIEIAYLPKATSANVIGRMTNTFAHWGDPQELVTDQGTQFTSAEFKDFARRCNMKQTFSSPHYPQGNGEAEAGVKIAKNILRQKDSFAAIRAYRSTPVSATGFSPSQLMIGRNIRTNVPCVPQNYQTEMAEITDGAGK